MVWGRFLFYFPSPCPLPQGERVYEILHYPQYDKEEAGVERGAAPFIQLPSQTGYPYSLTIPDESREPFPYEVEFERGRGEYAPNIQRKPRL
jgi:hypothetical protein